MHGVVNVTGRGGFLPAEAKGNPVLEQVLAQEIIDGYCGCLCLDPDVFQWVLEALNARAAVKLAGAILALIQITTLPNFLPIPFP